MKFSFQTVCILFLVTLVHLVLISAFSAMTGSSTTILSDIKADALLEELVLQASSSGEAPENKKEKVLEEEGRSKKSLPDNPLKAGRQEIMEEPLEPPVENILAKPAAREAEPQDVAAIADARLLSDRIESPNLKSYQPRLETLKAEEITSETKKEGQAVAAPTEVVAEPVPKPVPAPLAGEARSVRSIRPIPRS